MEVAILAGGLGTRLREVTAHTPMARGGNTAEKTRNRLKNAMVE